MKDWVMHWPERVHPYVRTTQRQKWVDKRYKKYNEWRNAFRNWANAQSFPSELDPKKTYRLSVKIHLKGKSRADVDNLAKAIMDSLFKQDRRILGLTIDVFESAGLVDSASIMLTEM